jgi:tetratricopeptide (TPR) repeat protein
MARRWYIAAGAYMEIVRHFQDAVPHLDRARQLFPDDPQVLFLSAAIHEHYAAPDIQAAIKGIPARVSGGGGVQIDMRPSVLSASDELNLAESLYRRALDRRPTDAETRLRLGRVVGLLGRHRDAIPLLTAAKTSFSDPQFRYYACLFLGRELHQTKSIDAARAEFREAAQLFPLARSPKLSLSQIAAELGDRAATLDELQGVLSAPPLASAARDPWTDYMFSHLRNLSALFEALFAVVPPPDSP